MSKESEFKKALNKRIKQIKVKLLAQSTQSTDAKSDFTFSLQLLAFLVSAFTFNLQL
ncbi:MAG: hypothetical protein ACUZ8E_04225 [Candidatus Anammoxibacter sp.]